MTRQLGTRNAERRTDLYRHSLDVMLGNQAATGAFLATPTMPDYHYCWFRDGSYVAYALDLAGEHAAAHRFHAWAAAVIGRHADTVARAEQMARAGRPPDQQAILHTRYTVDGQTGDQPWSNFQLDGFGTWLWAVADHLARYGDGKLPEAWRQGCELTGRYLAALWREPNSDLWEENAESRHSYTQAAVYAGLAAGARLLDRPDWSQAAEQVRAEVAQHAARIGHYTKFLSGGRGAGADGQEQRHVAVDASLLGVALPHGLAPVDDPLLAATVGKIEETLRPDGGGLHRYAWDTYYGGGEWVLLAAWLGWYYAASGEASRAREQLQWVEAQARENGDLPEQVPQHLIAPGQYQPWVERRGPIATPLLWSHANYVILCHALKIVAP